MSAQQDTPTKDRLHAITAFTVRSASDGGFPEGMENEKGMENENSKTTGWKPVGSGEIVNYGLKSFAHDGVT